MDGGCVVLIAYEVFEDSGAAEDGMFDRLQTKAISKRKMYEDEDEEEKRVLNVVGILT